ncbi:Shedu anti-phage system protein SduA domain-containing protein [Pseudoduganella sp. RAF53_2]|uniref:Shedu anti-phage system protein SduA domain-containing protein n=1 Tax=unclassified Pseudoduganella TaxID=2637179 RepID=UPI003F9E34F2
MKISDFIFRYQAHRDSVHDSICRVRLFHTDRVSALLTDLGDRNTGSSVANSIESLRHHLIDAGHIDQSARIVEHYEANHLSEATFALVTEVDGLPNWQKLCTADAAALLGCAEIALEHHTLDDPRLAAQIDKLRVQINPYIDRPQQESVAVLNRRNEILRQRIPVEQLRSLIEEGATALEMHHLIAQDLSLIAELYAQPEEEYIAFSQFPVDSGFVDFALFSGRSRMDVTLVEIKGTAFHLDEARAQISSRLGYIVRQYPQFRAMAHRIRDRVEQGHPAYNSFPGPRLPLQVEAARDINVNYVVIGGRAVDAVERQAFEMSFEPFIQLETWDSWLQKLRRN